MDLAKLHLHWRVSKHKGKSYRSYSLARAYRKDGKNRKEIIVKLGKLSDEAADRWRELLKAIKKMDSFVSTCDDISVTNHFAYLDIAIVSEIWNYWSLNEAFRDNGMRHVDVSNIARILTINRCIDPVSKSQIPEWFKNTALSWILDVEEDLINPSRIFRELEVIEKHKESICAHLFELMSRRNPESMDSIFYDLSSTTFTGSRCLLMKWGRCKEGYKNHIVLAIVVNKDGLPFYWEVLPGGTADATTITWLLERMKERFTVDNTTLVFDRGMVSDNNLSILEQSGIKFISAMDKNQIEGLTDVDFKEFYYLDAQKIEQQVKKLKDFKKNDETTYYREAATKEKRRYILCFNPQLFKDQVNSRNQSIVDFLSFTDELNNELLNAKRSRQQEATYKKFKKEASRFKLTKFIDISLKVKYIIGKTKKAKIRTYQATITVNEEKKKYAGRLDGFWLLVTNHIEKDDDRYKILAKKAINPYREKVIIEAAFRDIKSFVEVAPVFVWTEAHVKAHYTICVLSYLINRTLSLRLKECKGDLTSEIVSHEKLYSKLSSCMIDQIKIENVGLSTYNMTTPSKEQIELLSRIDMRELLKDNIIRKARAC